MARLAHTLRVSGAERTRQQHAETAARVAIQPPAHPAVVLVGEHPNDDVDDKISIRKRTIIIDKSSTTTATKKIKSDPNHSQQHQQHPSHKSTETRPTTIHPPQKRCFRYPTFPPFAPSYPPPRPIEILATSGAGGIFLVRHPPRRHHS